jgi:hypothetical protein
MKPQTVFNALVVAMLGLIVVYLLLPEQVRPDPCTGADLRAWIERARAQGADLPDFEHRSQW